MIKSPSVRQSPPPITGDGRMPNAALISPPESSDDDDLPRARTDAHGRKIENLKELQVAISQIPQTGLESPTQDVSDKQSTDAGDLLVLPQQANTIVASMHHSYSSSSLDGLTLGSRKFSHSRSQTEPHITLSKSSNSSATASDEESDGEPRRKPQMVRKKSGELVRPALRPASRRRPSSMPGTPTFSKAVHFDSHLEHVRHFLQVDRPLAVSAGSSPIDHYDSDSEYPFTATDRTTTRTGPSFEWEIIMRCFPVDTPARKAQTVRLERIWLSNDQKCLLGSVAVANLAFHKSVTCRFTLDYWKTTSEVAGEYAGEIRPVETSFAQDRFNFTIKLSDLANLESKTLYFCIRYNVNGQEHWDNNNGSNFQVDFKKKAVNQGGKSPLRTSSGLPKSNRRPSASPVQRTKPKSGGLEEFGVGSKLDFDQSFDDYLGDSRLGGLRLKGVKSSVNLPSDNISSRLSAPSGQAFANRYDFGASLTAAIQTAKDQMGNKSDGGLYMKPHRRLPVTATLDTKAGEKNAKPIEKPVEKPVEKAQPAKPTPAPTTAPAVGQPLSIPGTDSPGTSIASASYEELVNKYCFFGSKQSSPVYKEDPTRLGRFDGVEDVLRSHNSSSSTPSYEGSPVQMGNYRHSHSGTQHHSLYHRDPNPYFQHIPPFATMGASPAESPLMGFPIKRTPSPVKNQAAVQATSGQQTGYSSSPSMVGNFVPFAAIRS